jgi:alpha-L-fucosidase
LSSLGYLQCTADAYPADYMPPPTFYYEGFNYEFPEYKAAGNDNVIALGQTVNVPRGKYFSVQMLAASESGMGSGTINATYSDGTISSGAVLVPAWWSWPYPTGGDIVLPYYLTDESINYNRSNIFQTINWLDSSKELVSLTLPKVTSGSSTSPGGAPIGARMHIFALSLTPASNLHTSGPQLEVQFARSTQKWIDGTNKTQIFEVVVNNVGADFVLSNHSVSLSIDSPGLETVTKGTIKRLHPGDQAIVEVGVVNKKGVTAGSSGNATVVISGHDISSNSYTFNATYGIRPYEATYESIYSHESPNWYNNAKYGIFIHWGVYSVPGWGNSGSNEGYAEW